MSGRPSTSGGPSKGSTCLVALTLLASAACRQPIRTDSQPQQHTAETAQSTAPSAIAASASAPVSGSAETRTVSGASGSHAPALLQTQPECAANTPDCTSTLPSAPSTRSIPETASTSATPVETPDVIGTSTPTDPTARQRKPKFSQTYIVAFMGDSLTDYRSGGGRFISVLEKRCPYSQFDNYGKGGEMTNQMRRRFKRDVFGPKKPPYTHVVVFGGVNDLYSDLTANRTNAKIESDLSQMYTMAREGGANVIALTVSPWGGFRRYFNKTRAAHTRELNAWILGQRGKLVDDVIETSPLLSCGDPERLCESVQGGFKDGLHFGREGHEKLGEALFQQVFHDCR